MTTEHMHHEHDDADEVIVENSPTPESTDETSASHTTTAEEQGTSPTAAPSDPFASSEQQAAAQPEQPASAEPATAAENASAPFEQAPGQPVQEAEQSTHAPIAADADAPSVSPVPSASVQAQEQQPNASDASTADNAAASSEDTLHFSGSNEEEVRPFTSFIEEFRQAEEQARLNTALSQPPAEPFTLFTSVDEEVQSLRESDAAVIEPVVAQSGEAIATQESAAEETAQGEPAETAPAAAASPPTTQEEVSEGEQRANESAAAPLTRPAVSPLLRPASRLRSSRHTPRHQRAGAGHETAAASPSESATGAPAQEGTQPASAATPEAEQPKPARRYRFDRPAATTNGSAGTAQAPQATPAPSFARPETATGESAIEAARASTSSPEIAAGEQQNARLEQGATEETRATQVRENGKRTSGQDRQKEQVPPAATTGAAAEASGSDAAEKVAPEDLPPLEYSELQKSSRKRRRHRNGSNNGTTALTPGTPSTPATPSEAPVAQPLAAQPPIAQPPAAQPPIAQPPIAQPPAAQPPASTAATPVTPPYSIISGYTVSQMNQGSEQHGPFMGPEPSPARGSLITREGRSTQRPSSATSSYPTRTSESTPSAASFNHFTNMVVQALQAQTDRMVAELRRANQVPTNVSVSLPPFPSTERVGVFVDVANLLYSARTLRISVDFGKLLDFLRGNRRLVRAHAYCPTSPQAGDEQMFLQAVKGLGYRITTKNYKTFSSGAKKADLDLDLCMDVVRIVDGKAVDCIVLVSGDSDFMPMLDYCSDHGVRVEVAAFDEAMSATLRQSCDLFINLSMLEEIRS